MTETEERSVSKGLGIMAAFALAGSMPIAGRVNRFPVGIGPYAGRDCEPTGTYQPNQGPLTEAQVKARIDHDKRCAKGKRAKLRKRK